mmetsp:Transcript_37497/g.82218  ORF Transcript_37497/g.82218 Transcript_37497/m.82218 type:complete len:100 (+) Transcript_37497:741-1040(+)
MRWYSSIHDVFIAHGFAIATIVSAAAQQLDGLPASCNELISLTDAPFAHSRFSLSTTFTRARDATDDVANTLSMSVATLPRITRRASHVTLPVNPNPNR